MASARSRLNRLEELLWLLLTYLETLLVISEDMSRATCQEQACLFLPIKKRLKMAEKRWKLGLSGGSE
ncbi:MAG: hypothetical protein A6F71_09140 [Cycloclasticus sp. symbiont of Poecilosclerida sp. M]|nr:MAG: hypothetical protein A6F71_09140 [Cycloclasticus sp. symbiont of Poecilosclerida sp. M]